MWQRELYTRMFFVGRNLYTKSKKPKNLKKNFKN